MKPLNNVPVSLEHWLIHCAAPFIHHFSSRSSPSGLQQRKGPKFLNNTGQFELSLWAWGGWINQLLSSELILLSYSDWELCRQNGCSDAGWTAPVDLIPVESDCTVLWVCDCTDYWLDCDWTVAVCRYLWWDNNRQQRQQTAHHNTNDWSRQGKSPSQSQSSTQIPPC